MIRVGMGGAIATLTSIVLTLGGCGGGSEKSLRVSAAHAATCRPVRTQRNRPASKGR